MSELRVRNVDEWVIAELKKQARARGHSLEAELRDRLREWHCPEAGDGRPCRTPSGNYRPRTRAAA